MAHQIESMFYIGQTPWHGLGNRVFEAPSIAAAIKQSGLDWQVGLRPLFTADGRQVPNMATVRETDNKILGVVGPRWQPLQNDQAFAFFDPLVESKLVTLETAGSLQEGRRVWVLARINGGGGSDVKIVGDDIIRKFVLLSNSHDGTLAVRVGFTPVRVVCANTLAMAHDASESKLIRLIHSKAVVANLESLRGAMNLANQQFEATVDQFRALAGKQVNHRDLREYVKVVLGHGKTADEQISTVTENRIAEVISLFEHGRGHDLPGVKGTVWAAYNAVTEYFSHVVHADDADTRYTSLWYGNNAKRNRDALDAALTLIAA